MNQLSLAKDFIYRQPQTPLVFAEVGDVTMCDIGSENFESLKRFYNNNYYQDYILSDQKVFDWLFKNNGGAVAVLTKDGEVIAHQGHIPMVFTNWTTDYKGFFSTSTLVAAPYRRMKLMSKLRGSVHDRYRMAASIGGSKQGIGLYTAMGYHYLGDLTRLVAVVDPKLCVGVSQQPEVLTVTVSAANQSNEAAKKIERFEDIATELEALARKVFSVGKTFGVKRDAEFLDWRYSDHPTFDYERFGWWNEGALEAVVVFRRELIGEHNQPVIRITELFGNAQAMVDLVLSTVLTKQYADNIAWIDFSGSYQPTLEALKQAGFVEYQTLLPAKLPLLCQPIEYEKEVYPFLFWSTDESLYAALPPFEHWYVTKGDGDADRPNAVTHYTRDIYK